MRSGFLNRLSGFASQLIQSTRDPKMLEGVIRELNSVADQVPVGKRRWSLRTYIADGLSQFGRPDEALPIYEQAAAEAEAAEQWEYLDWIAQNWAIALREVGQLDLAIEKFKVSADCSRRTNLPAIGILSSELETLRIAVMKRQAEKVRPVIEKRLNQIRDWWRRTQDGETVPDAPEPATLGRVLIGALDIAGEAALALEDWEQRLALNCEVEEVQKALGLGEFELATSRYNQYSTLLKLGRFEEAQKGLEECLEGFRHYNDVRCQGQILTALAELWHGKNDPDQSADLERRALDLANRLPNPGDRAISHNNLAIYLEILGGTRNSACHWLAALCYDLIAGQSTLVGDHVGNLVNAMKKAQDRGVTFFLPTVETLLADAEFDALRRFLTERAASLPDLQRALDEILNKVKTELTMLGSKSTSS